MNLISGILFFLIFLFSGYWLSTNIVPQFAADSVIRMENRADHIYLLMVALLNILAWKCDYGYSPRWITVFSRLLLVLSGVCCSIGFWVESSAILQGRMLLPSGIGFAFFSVVLFIIGQFFRTGKER